ncbi:MULTISPECIES: muconolactone Delta-isomerase family protein [Cupriavidus]|uniref:muconolactone Delta-isomerase family protein n=1 Tax=Cupriavidus sp. DF5525 TaxID=3160989 RepID=UPI0032DFDC95
MLYCVQMDVKIPDSLAPERAEAIKAAEKARAIEIQKSGKWPHLWRMAGRYANVSIFDVDITALTVPAIGKFKMDEER